MNRCKTCVHRDSSGNCRSPKLQEDMDGEYGASRQDALIYSEAEGGAFWVGPEFGCVHHQEIAWLSDGATGAQFEDLAVLYNTAY